MGFSSKKFNLRLIELTACALHQIGVLLFQVDKLHDPTTTQGLDIDDVTSWERPPDQWARTKPWPTLFMHLHFGAHEQYPNGIADIVGYWAENRILGGVALFDHSQPWSDDNEPNVYFQCSRSRVTFRVCQLLDRQQAALVAFLKGDDDFESDSSKCPLPILPDENNRVRIDPKDAIEVRKVYRDLWERKPPAPPTLRMQGFGERDIMSSLDYPEMDVEAEIERINNMK